jgi:hypothetical protein
MDSKVMNGSSVLFKENLHRNQPDLDLEISTMEKLSRKSFEETTGNVLNQITMYFSPILFQAGKIKSKNYFFVAQPCFGYNEKRNAIRKRKKQIYDTRFPILRPPKGSSASIIFSRSYWYFTYSTKTFIAAERYLRLQIFFFSFFKFSKQQYHSQTFSTKTSGSINRF